MSCTLNSSLIGLDKAYRTTQTSMNYKTDILKGNTFSYLQIILSAKYDEMFVILCKKKKKKT